MKIDSSIIGLESQHSAVESHTVRESLRLWTGAAPPDAGGNPRAAAAGLSAAVVSISDAAQAAQSSQPDDDPDTTGDAGNDPRILLILRMVEAMTGRKIKLVKAAHWQLDTATQRNLQQAGASAARPRAGWGLEYDRHETHDEAEQTTFAARGVIKTADGQQIAFTLEFAMQRQYHQETAVSLRAGDAVRKDPLVINLDGTAAQLTDRKFAFDIDTDGKPDSLSFVAPGSGFLALDRNANGKIDNGSELFGTQSGNGFADLARYDSDGNQWIDENDAIFSELRIWSKDGAGQDSLGTLAQANVGALYLGNVATPFSLNAANNENLGQVRSSGVYLKENGAAGTMQQIDLTV